jgi:hypothetical protein
MMMLRILILKLKRKFIWAKHGEKWSWDRYEYELYQIAHKKLKKLSEKSTKELIKVYEFLSHGGFPENPAELEQDFLERVNNLCSCSIW